MTQQNVHAFRDSTALVTGAGSGIGRAMALALAHHGAQVVLTGRGVESLNETARAVEKAGGKAVIKLVDLTDSASVLQLGEAVDEACGGRLAFLIHCAGRYSIGSVEKMDLAEFDRTMNTNVRGPVTLTQRLLPSLMRARGDIVFVNSAAVFNPRAEIGAYTVSKAALRSFADCLRAEVNDAGVRVLTIFPTRTATPMQAAIFATEGRIYRPELLLQPEDVAGTIVNALSLPRTAELIELHIRHANKI